MGAKIVFIAENEKEICNILSSILIIGKIIANMAHKAM